MSRVAESVGLERTHLYRKLKQLGVKLTHGATNEPFGGVAIRSKTRYARRRPHAPGNYNCRSLEFSVDGRLLPMTSKAELANAIRALAMDAVQKANSGHPGMPMGMAEIAEVLWNNHLRHNPANPAVAGPRPFRAVQRPRLDAAVCAAASHRLRPADGRNSSTFASCIPRRRDIRNTA